MSGEPLMCVWQAVLAKDIDPDSGVKRATVLSVVRKLDNDSKLDTIITFSESRFLEFFIESKVKFEQFKDYVWTELLEPSIPMQVFQEKIESVCWRMCRSYFKSQALNQLNFMKIWKIFNQLCIPGSYPPIVPKIKSDFVLEKIAENLHKTWGSSFIPNNGFTFQEMVNVLDGFFSVSSDRLVYNCIEDLHTFLIKEVIKSGWLKSRMKKKSKWTNWSTRYFVMTPGHIKYYKNAKQKKMYGDIMLDKRTSVENMEPFKSLMSIKEFRFKVINESTFEMEMCSENEEEKQEWLKYLYINLEATNMGLTPQLYLIQKRNSVAKQQHTFTPLKYKESEDKYNAGKQHVKIAENENWENAGNYNNDHTCESPLELQKDKIRAVFMQIDKDGSGTIDKDEFSIFLQDLGLKLERSEMDSIFKSVDKDNNQSIYFEEFIDYFVKFVLEKSTDSSLEAELRKAFLKADRDGSGAINFSEFYEYAHAQKSNVNRSALLSAFKALDTQNTGEIKVEQFQKFFEKDAAKSNVGNNSQPHSSSIENALKNTYEKSSADDLADYLNSRWNKFVNFKRYGDKGELVMAGNEEMVSDIVPGHYNLLDLACFNDLPPIEPQKAIIKGVKWIDEKYAIFPSSFDGEVPVDIATNEHLSYYNSCIASGNQLEVSLMYRHGVQDFTYENSYLDEYVTSETEAGGAGLEYHKFAHLDCPLDDKSGYFVIGKFVGDDLHLTAFHVPTRHTIYVPPDVIHCNDYQKGTWRTMLSDAVGINHVQIVKTHNQENQDAFKHFAFSFNKKPAI